ncbi:MAG TPA: RloB domain-containing protein [Candidatus Gallacutalibacter stercoravium]|nr:RloB domain-containing protein [Candidatus Gallacutalibacter stercoravium]
MPDRNGKRKTREQLSKRRIPELGYYYIVTDTEATEHNYMVGLRDSIPKELQGKLVIKVSKAKTVELVDQAYAQASLLSQYSEPWIVFDRDQVEGFDEIIHAANQMGINVGWSNPCIEVWFNAYFGAMPTYQNSVQCCNGFSEAFFKATGQKYKKSDPDIYGKLNHFGDEQQAIRLAEQKLKQQWQSGNSTPSQMCPCTTLHKLVQEIKEKIKGHA